MSSSRATYSTTARNCVFLFVSTRPTLTGGVVFSISRATVERIAVTSLRFQTEYVQCVVQFTDWSCETLANKEKQMLGDDSVWLDVNKLLLVSSQRISRAFWSKLS